MEAVGAIASIAGVLGLASQGLKLIQSLEEFCRAREEEDDDAQLFIAELIASASVLSDVKGFCERLKNSSAYDGFRFEFRLASLKLQVEECVRDLEIWERSIRFPFQLRLKGSKYVRTKRSVMNVINTVLKLSSADKNSLREQQLEEEAQSEVNENVASLVITYQEREKQEALKHETRVLGLDKRRNQLLRNRTRDRFARHRDNIQVSLTVLGRNMEVSNAEELRGIHNKLDIVQRNQQHQIQTTEDMCQKLSDNSSNIMEHFGLHSESLAQVKSSVATLHSKLEEVLTEIRSGSSQSSSAVSSGRISVLEPNTLSLPQYVWDTAIDTSSSPASDARVDNGRLSELWDLPENPLKDYMATKKDQCSMIVATLEAQCLHDLVQPSMTYFGWVEVWRLIQVTNAIKSLETNNIQSNDTAEYRNSETLDQHIDCAEQLVACRRPLLNHASEAINLIDLALGISDDLIAEWKALALQKNVSSSTLPLEQSTILVDQKKEASIRVNEWLLEMTYSSTYLRTVHNLEIDNYVESSAERDRYIIQTWFHDNAAHIVSSYAPSHLSGIGSDSDVTVMKFDSSVDDMNLDAVFDDEPTPALVRESRLRTKMRLGAIHFDLIDVNEPPNNATASALQRAQEALREYGSDFDWPAVESKSRSWSPPPLRTVPQLWVQRLEMDDK